MESANIWAHAAIVARKKRDSTISLGSTSGWSARTETQAKAERQAVATPAAAASAQIGRMCSGTAVAAVISRADPSVSVTAPGQCSGAMRL